MGLYEERLARVRAAVNLEPVDRVPHLSAGPAAMAAYSKVPLKDYVSDMELNCTANIKYVNDFNMDGTQAPIFDPNILFLQWFSPIVLPGEGSVGENELWQVHEKEVMSEDDYDKILENGYDEWRVDFLTKKYDAFNKSKKYFDYYPTALKRHKEAGIPSFVDGVFQSPFESLCGARSLETFLIDDLMESPEKVEKVFEKVHEFNMKSYIAQIENPETRPIGVWVGGWRGTPSMLNTEMFEQYSWKYMRELIDLCIQYDIIPLCHLDSNWDNGLEYFKTIPAKKAIVSLDGKTDMYLAKEILGGHSCIMGDVPAEMLAFAKPEKVYAYASKLIKDIGPTGYIMCSGCDVPFNADFENVKMMQKAVEDSAVK
ncbi:uroporphyrinogen decarboxylase family protein [Parasporobacterium paucivorans]|uniref:Uroporphyrinogen-III decarboxylase n=1 Tax=Parasporobacterium paucivorans DSM 15970 TaxID=1122934 RepID=A0A1M6GAW3_9FIRM|nr:uroporphyrinogen decarboxylase family protein [Parasporobacterium paucivorans]SHJ06987.1 Uroporphyrinogen-III decarboxylase [Parasporobacterium paucivorans DSM 15970]